MSSLEYYKSLITDDEVINALVRESKAREGEFEKTRVRPNMNFLQRTVNNMLSSNQRITSKQEKKKAEEKEKNATYKPRKIISRKRTARELIHEILTSQTKFVSSSVAEDEHFSHKGEEPAKVSDNGPSNASQKQTDMKKTENIPKTINTDQWEDGVIISSSDDEQFTNILKTEPLPEPAILSSDHPIQISSDEDTIDVQISGDPEYHYKKKKCKRRHKFHKSKKKFKT